MVVLLAIRQSYARAANAPALELTLCSFCMLTDAGRGRNGWIGLRARQWQQRSRCREGCDADDPMMLQKRVSFGIEPAE